MPVWPKSLYTFRVSLQTAATEWKLRQTRNAPAAQEKTLPALTAKLATASVWKAAGIEPRMEYRTFRDRVPLSSAEQLAPAVERMKRGEADVLWPGRCTLFARSSGTATGVPRELPMTEEMLAHLRRAGLDALLYYTVRVRHAGVFRGRHLFYGASPALAPLDDAGQAFAGEASGIGALSLPRWADKHLYEPGVAIAQLGDWDKQLQAIAGRCRSQDVTLVAGLPCWTALIGETLRETFSDEKLRVTHLQAQWPNLECYVHSGMLLAPYAEQLRDVLGPAVKFHEVYAATEGFFACQDVEGARGLRLMVDLGIFFEFLPLAEFDEARLEQLGSKAVPLSSVKTGVDYALIVTTPGGLARCVVGDVVRFISTTPPRLVYLGGTKLRLNSFGENVNEREVTDALVAICERRGWTIVNYHVAPLPAGGAFPRNRGRHEWWVELRPGTIATPTGPQMAADLDVELQRLNEGYAARRKTGSIDAPFVRLVMPGVFEHWLRHHGRWGGQSKMPRCRSDRVIADELGQVTSFARD